MGSITRAPAVVSGPVQRAKTQYRALAPALVYTSLPGTLGPPCHIMTHLFSFSLVWPSHPELLAH